MTTQVVELEAEPPDPSPEPTPSGGWWRGVWTVTVLELRQRVRSTRWIVALIVWFVVVGGITLLTSGALATMTDTEVAGSSDTGPLLFAVVSFLVLGLGLLVTPTLTSTGINGDRNAGTLATLQVTLLSPSEIAMGKVLAAWFAACAFLVASLPFLALAVAMGGTPVMSLVRVVVIVALLLAAVCGIGLGYSSSVARTAGSTVLTFLTVAALTLLTPILFATTYPSITREETVQVYATVPTADGEDYRCDYVTTQRRVAHTERTWWLLGINPFVVLADGAEAARTSNEPYDDPLEAIRAGVRMLRAGVESTDECWINGTPLEQPEISETPFWFWGLGANLLLGAVGFAVAVRRLRIPQKKLARGTRVA